MGCCSNKRTRVISVSVIAVVLLTLGICSVTLWNTIYSEMMYKELTISNNSNGYNFWKETPIPMYLNVYLFNWTNAKEVVQNWSIKPVFEEVGPYVFTEQHIRTNLTWENDNHTVTYYQKRIWKFIPGKSNGSLSDKVTNLNVIAVAASYLVRNQIIFTKEIVSFFINLKEKSLIQTRTVDEWLFTGYKDSLLQMISTLNITAFKSLTGDRFGWFYGRNNSDTYDGNFTMFTGVNNIELLGIIDKWNGKSYSTYFNSYCSLVNGTSGELWPPVDKYQSVSIFASDLCSSINLTHVDFSDEIVGLKGKKYVGTDFVFDNGTKYPEQKCFTTDESFPSGVRDISKCKFGAPAFMSYPHFYLADSSFREAIIGMQPNKSQHEFYVVLEPNTGIPLSVRASMQLNLYVQPIKGITMFKNVKPTFIPMVYFTQTATLTKDLAQQAKTLLILPSIFIYTGYALIGISVLLALAVIYISFNKAWLTREEESLLGTPADGNLQ